MIYTIVDTEKTVEQAATDLEKAVANNKFGTLHIHKISDILKNKGFDMKEEVLVFEICQPGYAFDVLAHDMRINMALPCRISIYTEKGQTKIGMLNPKLLFTMLPDAEALAPIAEAVQTTMEAMINEAK